MKVDFEGKKLTVTKEHKALGADAAKQKAETGKNPPSWVEDEAAWTRAKEAAGKTYDESDEAYWPVVTTIYKNIVNSTEAKPAKVVKAAATGQPSVSQLMSKVTAAIQEDPRWDTDKHGQAEGTPGDFEPWCVDVLVPEKDGRWCAVIRTDDNRLVKHYFTLGEDGRVAMDEGESDATEATQVYSKQIEEHEVVKSAGGNEPGHPFWGNQWTDAMEYSKRATRATEEAYEGDETPHKHEKAAMMHEEASRRFSNLDSEGARDMQDAHKAWAKSAKQRAAEILKRGKDKNPSVLRDLFGSDSKVNDVVHCKLSSAQFDAEAEAPVSEFQWMPGGVTTITASYNAKPIELTIRCDETAASRVAESFNRCVETSPRRPPFGCVEHREEEAAFHPKAFDWRTDPEPGIFCKAEWTALGVRNVRGKIHTSFSPSFSTDAEYGKAREVGGVLVFPDGVRGSASNPAQVTGVSPKSVGSLTNWPAFKAIMPVKAKESKTEPPKAPELPNKVTADTIYARFAERDKQVQEIYVRHIGTPERPTLEAIYASRA